jgi:hypothetical protein
VSEPACLMERQRINVNPQSHHPALIHDKPSNICSAIGAGDAECICQNTGCSLRRLGKKTTICSIAGLTMHRCVGHQCPVWNKEGADSLQIA